MVEKYEEVSPPIADVDIWRAADQMVRLYGEGALWRATMRADALLDQGDSQGFFAWKRIARAIDDLGRGPRAGEARN
jgi:hypothetical protein